MKFLQPIWSMPRPAKRFVSILVDSIFIVGAFWAALFTRLGINKELFYENSYWSILLLLFPCTIIIFARFGLYRAVLRFLSFHAVLVIFIATCISSVLIILFSYFNQAFMPRSVPILYATYLLLFSGGSRLAVRALLSDVLGKKKIKVLIYGAGSAGRQLAEVLRYGNIYHPAYFVDDNKRLHNSRINGIVVFNSQHLKVLINKHKIEKVLLAIPSASRSQRQAIIESLIELHIEVLSIPSFDDITNGKASIDELQDVPIEDLLGRDPVDPNPELLSANIAGKVVMVTGAGGSIGSELCRQIVRQKPVRLVLFELSEFGLYQIDHELKLLVKDESLDIEIVPLLGSVQRINRLITTMKAFEVETLYHAAAYKHVPLVEYNVVEGVRNNVFGTYYTAKAAIEAGVESFVLISTDKAVRPTNMMGTTKRMAELGLQALAEHENNKEKGTRFCMVRFGNVLGSSGSVIPLFKKQINRGGPLTVTHPEIIRYFMTIPEAAQLVIQAGSMGKGGDVFVLDMGEPVKLAELAEKLIQLSGLEVKSADNPYGDIEIQYTGLRPGEKLYEELLIGEKNVEKTPHERIMSAYEQYLPYGEYKELIDKLDRACHNFEHEIIRELMLNVPTGFSPTSGIEDLVWKQQSIHVVENSTSSTTA